MASKPIVLKLKFILGKLSVEIPPESLPAFQSLMNQWIQVLGTGPGAMSQQPMSNNPQVNNLVSQIVSDVQAETNQEAAKLNTPVGGSKKVGYGRYGYYNNYYWNSWYPYWYYQWTPYYWWPYRYPYYPYAYSGYSAIGGSRNYKTMASSLGQFRG